MNLGIFIILQINEKYIGMSTVLRDLNIKTFSVCYFRLFECV